MNYDAIDLFAGAGGIRQAMEWANITCKYTNEYDKFARKTYAANFEGDIDPRSIRDVRAQDIPEHDILTAGFPCPAFSMAGISRRSAMGKPSGFDYTEGGGDLFFDIIRIAEYHKPPVLLLENVANLLTHKKGRTFRIMRAELENIGYTVHHKIIDGALYVPQRRKRVFMVCTYEKTFTFPTSPLARSVTFPKILEDGINGEYTLTDKMWRGLQAHKTRHAAKGNGFGYTLIANRESQIVPTLRAGDPSAVLLYQKYQNPRRLTPREYARLMGFPESFVLPCSKTQSYKQMGNSVVVPLVYDLLEAIKECLA